MTIKFIGGPYDGVVRNLRIPFSRRIVVPIKLPGGLGKIEYAVDALQVNGRLHENSPYYYRFVKWVAVPVKEA